MVKLIGVEYAPATDGSGLGRIMATRADDFTLVWMTLKQLEGCRTVSSLQATVLSAMATYGYAHVTFRSAETVTNKRSSLHRTLLCSWPKDWFDQYHAEDLSGRDPVVKMLRRVDHSFRWSEAKPATAMERRTMQIARDDHHLRQGICVPIRNFEGLYAAASFAGKHVDESESGRFFAELISIYAFNRLSQLQGNVSPARMLTERQREILTWVAAGKTAWDTSMILGISVNTVNKTIANAMLRLNVHTRAQAIVAAIRRGEIAP